MTAAGSRRVLLLALLLATVSAVLAYQLVASRLSPAPEIVEVMPESGAPVLVGSRSIANGDLLTAGDVKIVYVDAAAKGERALTDSDQAITKVALVDIPEGEQILAGSVADASDTTLLARNTFAREVPVGMRAVTISTEETVGVGGFVQPGDRVDVIAGFELERVRPAVGTQDAAADDSGDESEDPFPVAELILQDVAVLAVGQAMDAAPDVAAAAITDDETSAEPATGPVTRPEATSVTLLVDPSQALRLLLAVQAEGTFRLLLRAPGDSTITELPPALITDGAVEMEPFELVGANLRPEELVITSARFEEQSIPAGGVLEFEVTVRNVSSRLIPAGGGGANPGHVYSRDASWETIAETPRPGVFGIALTSETAGQVTYPWRWDLGQDLAPGESVTLTGGVQVPNVAGVHRWWFGVMLQPGTVVEDGVGITAVTIEPASSVVVTSPAIDLREAPWPDAAIVQPAARGDQAEVLEFRDGWFLIRAGEQDGWVPEDAVINTLLPAAASIADAAEIGQADVESGQEGSQ